MLVSEVRSFYELGFVVGLNELTLDFDVELSPEHKEMFSVGCEEGNAALIMAKSLGSGELSEAFVSYRDRKRAEVGL